MTPLILTSSWGTASSVPGEPFSMRLDLVRPSRHNAYYPWARVDVDFLDEDTEYAALELIQHIMKELV